jgi:succinate dehydrogenase/fumarate reductase cytochrome b subunit
MQSLKATEIEGEKAQKSFLRGAKLKNSKDVPKGMQSLVYSSVGAWVCVFVILIILHHITISFRITLHHTSYCIDDTRIEYESNLRKNVSLK